MANLIPNGSFAGHADGWYAASAGCLLAYDAGSRSGGTGALSFQKSGAPAVGATAEIQFRPGGTLIALGGLTTIDVVAWMQGGTGNSCRFTVAFYDDAYGTNFIDIVNSTGAPTALATGTWVEVASRELAVPEGATHAHLIPRYTKTVLDVPCLIDDVYLGAVGGDDPPYAGATLPLVQRIGNGDFEASAAGWVGMWEVETIARTTTSPISGTGSLSVSTPGGGDGQGISTPMLGTGLPVIGDEALRLNFAIKGSGSLVAQVSYKDTGGTVNVWSGTLTGSTQVVSVDFVAPSVSYGATLSFIAADDQPVAFVLDDVEFGSPAEVGEPNFPTGGVIAYLGRGT
jgi:hypothetical protein